MTRPRILTTHVGSLVRPDDFRAVLRRKVAGEISDSAFSGKLAEAVDWVVTQQARIGIDVVSDGEYGKIGGWEQYVLSRLIGSGYPVGVEESGAVAVGDMQRFADFYAEYMPTQEHPESVIPCVGEIEYIGQDELQRDIGNLKSAMAETGVEQGVRINARRL